MEPKILHPDQHTERDSAPVAAAGSTDVAATDSASVGDAVRAVLDDHPLITRLRTKKASARLIARLEPLAESQTELGLRGKDGVVFEVSLQHGRLNCIRTLVAQGPSLSNPINLTSAFTIPLDCDPTDDFLEDEEKKGSWEFAQYKCYAALAHNPNIADRLSIEDSVVFYTWRYGHPDGEKLQILIDDTAFQIFFNREGLGMTRKFDPATITCIELDRAIAKSCGAPLLPEEEPPPYQPPVMSETYEVAPDPVDEIIKNSLDKPRFARAQCGIVAYGSDEGIGYKDWNEDRVVINTGTNSFAVIDVAGTPFSRHF
ncbi:MAG: hypothetical protein AAB592_03935 [Patescibacteria group bacterium]